MNSSAKPSTAVAGAISETAESAQAVDDALASFLAQYADAAPTELVIVIPAFNEEESVASTVQAVPAEVCGVTTSTLVVDDGSTDGTRREAARAGAMVCTLAMNVGQGVALRLGYRIASSRGASYIGTADADGQFDPGELPRLLAPILAGQADLVNGSRRLGQNRQTDPVRRLGVAVFGTLVSALTGVRITDPANGLRVWRTEVTDVVPMKQTQYQTSELLIRTVAHGFRVVEVPVTMYEREAGQSKKGRNWRYGARFARVVVTTWWEERRRTGRIVLNGHRARR